MLEKTIEEVKAECRKINKPYQRVVAINCHHIGDDNDYSCFLSGVVRKLFTIDKEMAYKLFLTDSLIHSNIGFDDFCKFIEG